MTVSSIGKSPHRAFGKNVSCLAFVIKSGRWLHGSHFRLRPLKRLNNEP